MVYIRGRQRGWSLAEMLVAVAIALVLLTLAVPAMGRWLDRWQLDTAVHAVLSDLALIRSEAIRRGGLVVMCTAAETASACDDTLDWSSGCLLFVDLNGNARRDADEPIVRHGERLPGGWVLKGNTPVRRYVAYHASGRTRQVSGALQMGTFTLCKPGSGMNGRQIVISASGRPRVQSAAANACG